MCGGSGVWWGGIGVGGDGGGGKEGFLGKLALILRR